MKILFKIISAFLYFNCVSPVLMYYIYDENPNVGYIAAVSGTRPHKNRVNSHKKYFIGSNNQKYMKLVNERAVDSHFTVLKTPPKTLGINENDRLFIRNNDDHKNNERPNTRVKEEVRYEHEATNAETDTIYHEKEKTTPSDNQAYTSNNVAFNYNQHQLLRNGERNDEHLYEKKVNFVEVNANKAQISKEQKQVNINIKNVKSNNPQNPRQAQIYHQRSSGSGIKDKILHKASKTNDRNSQLLPRNELTQRKPEPNLQKMDSRKRETLDTRTSVANNNIKTNSISESMKKYIHKDINKYKDRNNAVPSRIGIHEEMVEVNETPYALFYKMNPEHHMNEELDVLNENPMEDPASSAYNGKMTWNYENQVESTKKYKRASNVKMNKKVKNFTSYRNR